MAATVSKRQQARNERMLQDLLRTVPGNDRCADCGARNPGWASWSLGIFLCMRCAALHRKLGTHISKVKSLSMDSWSAEQVDNMKSVGNVVSNKLYNPRGVNADIPVDIDEVEAAVEKHIRAKYETRTLSGRSRPAAPAVRQDTGSTGTDSWNDEPPALPPKPGKRFGFSLRSASSTYPRDKHDKSTPPMTPEYLGSDRSTEVSNYKKTNKPSHLFGMKITTIENNFNAKLARLRAMGFEDTAKNTDLLKSMDGNLERTVEALTRLGEGSRSAPPIPRTMTPVSMGSSDLGGLTVEKRRAPETKASNNPWDIPAEPVRSVAQAVPGIAFEQPRAQSVPPASASWNPFAVQTQPFQSTLTSIENSFQNLQVSPTGPSAGYGVPQPQYQNNGSSQSTNPWLPQPQHSTSAPAAQQPLYPPIQPAMNAFFQQPTQAFAASNPWAQQAPQLQASAVQQASNPFGTAWQQPNFFQQQPAVSPAPIYGQQAGFFSPPQPLPTVPQSQPQPQFQNPSLQQSTVGGGQNPWQQQMAPQQPQYAPALQAPFAPAQPVGQPPVVRHDKSSILALYGQQQLAPQRPLQTLPEDTALPAAQFATAQAPPPPQRSVTMPVGGPSPVGDYGNTINNMNPFAPAGGMSVPPQTQNNPIRHASHESVEFQGFAGNGRHSPDAFAGLSARYTR